MIIGWELEAQDKAAFVRDIIYEIFVQQWTGSGETDRRRCRTQKMVNWAKFSQSSLVGGVSMKKSEVVVLFTSWKNPSVN